MAFTAMTVKSTNDIQNGESRRKSGYFERKRRGVRLTVLRTNGVAADPLSLDRQKVFRIHLTGHENLRSGILKENLYEMQKDRLDLQNLP